jgi:hypothetical protein
MEVTVGDVKAKCLGCGGTGFVLVGPGGQRDAQLACEGCGAKYSRAQLLMQIGEQASRAAAESLARLKRGRPNK